MQQLTLTQAQPVAALAPREFVRRPSERLIMTLEAQDSDSRRGAEFFAVARALAHDALEYVRVTQEARP